MAPHQQLVFLLLTLLYNYILQVPLPPSPPFFAAQHRGAVPTHAQLLPGIMTLLHACLSHFFPSCMLLYIHTYMQQHMQPACMQAGGRRGG